MDHLANFWKYVHKLVGALRPQMVFIKQQTFHWGEPSWDINQTICFLPRRVRLQLLDGSNRDSPLIHR